MIVAIPAGWAESGGVDPASQLGPEAVIYRYRAVELTRDSVVGWDSVEGLIPVGTDVTEMLLKQLPHLRVVSVPGTGVGNYIDVPAATRRHVAVCNVRDYASDTIAELTIGLAVVLARRVLEADHAVRKGRWAPEDFDGFQLRGRTLGLIGLGSIGARVAVLARAIGMDVLCTTRRPSGPRAVRHNVRFVPLEMLLALADVVSLHVALTEETRGLMGREELFGMKPGSILLNTARGALIDEKALVDALVTHHLAGAALDVFECEPLPSEHPLTRLPNVVLTPHLAAGTREARERSVRMCLTNIKQFFAGQPQNLVNPEVEAKWIAGSSC
jgi:phosphoglycerate dehydrogenase-like enzyme